MKIEKEVSMRPISSSNSSPLYEGKHDETKKTHKKEKGKVGHVGKEIISKIHPEIDFKKQPQISFLKTLAISEAPVNLIVNPRTSISLIGKPECNFILIFKLVDNQLSLVADELHADVSIMKYATGRFDVVFKENCNREDLSKAIKMQQQEIGIKDMKDVEYYALNDRNWTKFHVEIKEKYPMLSMAEQPFALEEEKKARGEKASSSKNQTIGKAPAFNRKEISPEILAKLPIPIVKMAFQALMKHPDVSRLKAEKQKQILHEYLEWTLMAYAIYKENIVAEAKERQIPVEALKKELTFWQDSLPPFPIIVKSNTQLFRGDLKAKTLELISNYFETHQREKEIINPLAIS